MVDRQSAGPLCRLCGIRHPPDCLVEIFQSFDSDLDLAASISQLLHIHVKRDDGLPQVLCRLCHDKLLQLQEFQSTCQRVQSQLLDNCGSSAVSGGNQIDGAQTLQGNNKSTSRQVTQAPCSQQVTQALSSSKCVTQNSMSDEAVEAATMAVLGTSVLPSGGLPAGEVWKIVGDSDLKTIQPSEVSVRKSASCESKRPPGQIPSGHGISHVETTFRRTDVRRNAVSTREIPNPVPCTSQTDDMLLRSSGNVCGRAESSTDSSGGTCVADGVKPSAQGVSSDAEQNSVTPACESSLVKLQHWLTSGFPTGTVILPKLASKLYVLPDGSMFEIQDKLQISKKGSDKSEKIPNLSQAMSNMPYLPLKRKRGRPPTRKETILKNLTVALKNCAEGMQVKPSVNVSRQPSPVYHNQLIPRHRQLSCGVMLNLPVRSNPAVVRPMQPHKLPSHLPLNTDGRLLLPKLNLGSDGTPDIAHCCPKCCTYFLTKDALIEHSRSHPELKPCPVCSLPFIHHAKMLHHISEQHPKHICSHAGCNKYSANSDTIKKHSLVHVDEYGFVCETCGAKFKSANYLRRHCERAHNPARPTYSCSFCGKSFKWKLSFKYHIHYHLNGSFTCSQCPKTFQTKESLVRHERAVHGKYAAHICRVCHRSFDDHHTLLGHWKRHFKLQKKVHHCHWPDCTFSDYIPARVEEHISQLHQKLAPLDDLSMTAEKAGSQNRNESTTSHDLLGSSRSDGLVNELECHGGDSIMMDCSLTDANKDHTLLQKSNSQPFEVLQATIHKLQDRLHPSHKQDDAVPQAGEVNTEDEDSHLRDVLVESDIPAEEEVVIVEPPFSLSEAPSDNIDNIGETVVIDGRIEMDSFSGNTISPAPATCTASVNTSSSFCFRAEDLSQMSMLLNNGSSPTHPAHPTVRPASLKMDRMCGVETMTIEPVAQPLIIVERCGNSATATVHTGGDGDSQGDVLAELHYES